MELLTPAELRGALKIGRDRYRELLDDGMPYVPMSDKPGSHRRFDYDKVVEWMSTRYGKGDSNE